MGIRENLTSNVGKMWLELRSNHIFPPFEVRFSLRNLNAVGTHGDRGDIITEPKSTFAGDRGDITFPNARFARKSNLTFKFLKFGMRGPRGHNLS